MSSRPRALSPLRWLGLALGLTAGPSLAGAMSFPPPAPAPTLAGPFFPPSVGLVVERATVHADCAPEAAAPSCSVTARFFLRNETGADVDTAALFTSTFGQSLAIDGPARASGEPATLARLAAEKASRVPRPSRRWQSRVPPRALRVAHARLFVAKGQSSVLEARVRLSALRAYHPDGPFPPAAMGRHILARRERAPRGSYRIAFDLAPRAKLAPDFTFAIDVRAPSSLTPKVDPFEGGLGSRRGESERDGAHEISRWRLGPKQRNAELRFELHDDALRFGGPLLGFGATLGDGSGFRARFGAEWHRRGWLMPALHVDTDFRSQAIVAPVVELATPFLLMIPSLGVGVGAPVRLAATSTVGVRALASATYLHLGFVTTFDFFPALARSSPDRFRVTMMAQITF